MQALVFPEFAVKQAFRELNIERDDDAVIASIQNELLPRCMMIVIKSAIVSCHNSKRKYISERDIKYALDCCTFPKSKRHATDIGYLLDMRHFGKVCNLQIEFVVDHMVKHGIEANIVKVSADTLITLQDAVERLLRGFFEFYAHKGKGRTYGYRLFDECMLNLIGEPAEETYFVPI